MDRVKKLLELIEEDPKEAFNYYALALEYRKLDQAEKAENKFSFLVEFHPDFLATYYHYADLLVYTEEFEKAMQLYEQGIKKAQEQNDQHTLSELKNAKLNLELEMD